MDIIAQTMFYDMIDLLLLLSVRVAAVYVMVTAAVAAAGAVAGLVNDRLHCCQNEGSHLHIQRPVLSIVLP